MKRLVIIGAGIGGLTAAAALARAGLDVTVLEAHVYAGGCAGTFYHQGYRFDAGTTLAGGFYPGGPMDRVAQAAGIERWPARSASPAMVVHLPGGEQVTRWGDERRWEERRNAFGESSLPFWRWQERTADALWALALRQPAWPPQTASEAIQLASTGLNWLREDWRNRLSPELLGDAFRPAAAHLNNAPESLRDFGDAQLLISAQTDSTQANALFAASALDLPRRGVVHLRGGMGGIAETLVTAIRNAGGTVLLRQQVKRIVREKGRPIAVETRRGDSFPADIVVANLTPWNIRPLLEAPLPPRLARLPERPADGWSAFMVYVGLDEDALPFNLALHHQIIRGRPLAEGNTLFLSLSPAWDTGRAPQGRRALTISTHTDLRPWWDLFEHDRSAYEQRKATYTEKILRAAEQVLPGLRDASDLALPGTPVTFQRFTRRAGGWVGGFPQTNLFRTWGPRLAPDLWMVGDSIFPGQSTAAVALGGLRVAHGIATGLGMRLDEPAAMNMNALNTRPEIEYS
ncbi:MAG: FAD-dependent oxidoreductase [Caldilineales bacterium]|nr:FAD-dependent oxidoreductase [Caldilineales bacterium]